jgi:hypothetical protein
VMQLAAWIQLPPVHPPAGLTLSRWGEAGAARFYGVYQAAFRDRPGGPGRTQAGWVEWISDDEDFRPEWTLLATLDGTDVGFIAAEATGWIAQLGVVPPARGRGGHHAQRRRRQPARCRFVWQARIYPNWPSRPLSASPVSCRLTSRS